MLLILLTLLGCKAPPEAPKDFDDLCSWLYAQHPNEDVALYGQGLDNLSTWMNTHYDDASDGYVVQGISDEDADALDGTDRSVSGIFGVAVITQSFHTVEEAAVAMVDADQEDIHDGMYSDYERTYHSDEGCFIDQTCARLEAAEIYTANFMLGVQSKNHTWNQYLWVDTTSGLAMAHRAWLIEPPEVNFSWLAVEDQYYLDVFVPTDTGHRRLQLTWMVYDGEQVPESTVQMLVVDGMQKHSEHLDAWLDGD